MSQAAFVFICHTYYVSNPYPTPVPNRKVDRAIGQSSSFAIWRFCSLRIIEPSLNVPSLPVSPRQPVSHLVCRLTFPYCFGDSSISIINTGKIKLILVSLNTTTRNAHVTDYHASLSSIFQLMWLEKNKLPAVFLKFRESKFLFFLPVFLLYGSTDGRSSQGWCLSSVHFISSVSQKSSHLLCLSSSSHLSMQYERSTQGREWAGAKESLQLSFQEICRSVAQLIDFPLKL